MRSPKQLIFLCMLCIGSAVYGQNVYPIATNNCYLDEFILESDSIIAQASTEKIIEAVTASWDDKMKDKIEGVLGLQILVDHRGNSCLVSYRNDTNQKPKKLNLEANINDNLQWPRQAKKVSAIVVMEFAKGEITVKRMGTKDYVNLVELDH